MSAASGKGKGKGKGKGWLLFRIPGARNICSAQVVKLATRIRPVPTLEHVRLLILRSLK